MKKLIAIVSIFILLTGCASTVKDLKLGDTLEGQSEVISSVVSNVVTAVVNAVVDSVSKLDLSKLTAAK